jgi:predicted N-acetyltransferase YhbS
MLIRPETPRDYADIASVNVRAFGGRVVEALIVALHRHRRLFDPELSLVAEIDGQVVGHALFSPQTIRLLGSDVPAVNLAPIAVDPAFQRKGVGAALMEEGHAVARRKSYPLSYLLGHIEYYPRFGYRTGAFGASSIQVTMAGLPKCTLQSRAPREEDIPALRGLWRHEEGQVDFAIDPGDTLLDWLSPNPLIAATIYLRDGQIVGYTRIRSTEPANPRLFLAADAATALEMAADIGYIVTSITLPLHPLSASASAFGAPHAEAWGAGMALSLAPNPFDEYYVRVQAGQRPPGRPIWPSVFDSE